MRRLLALFLLVSLSFAGTHSYSASSGPLPLSTQITITPTVVFSPANPSPGSTVMVNMSLASFYYGSIFSASLTSPLNPGYSGGGSGTTSINVVDQASFDLGLYYYNNCGYTDSQIGAGTIRCSDIIESGCGGGSCSSGDVVAVFINGRKTVTYLEAFGSGYTSHTGGADVAAYCTGRWYVNGNDAGAITSSRTTYQVTIPSSWTQPAYPLSVEARYRCLFGAKEVYTSSPSYVIFWYYNAQEYTNLTFINISVGCQDNASIRIDSITNPINLNARTNGNATVSLVVRNNGTVPVTITSVVPSVGTFTPSGSYPVIQPGQAATITGTYNYPATLSGPISVTFTVYGNAVRCGTPVQVSASITTIVNPPACTDVASATLSATDPINLVGGQAAITLSVTNTGNVPITIQSASNITASIGTFTPGVSFPITIQPGQTSVISGTYTYTGTRPASVTFTVRFSATVCGEPFAQAITDTSQIPCPETASISLTATNPINLNSTNQSRVNLTITNTGNVPVVLQGASGISVNRGTFVPDAGTPFPITIQPGQSVVVGGVYTYNGAVPTTATFAVSVSATICGSAVTRTASYTSSVQRPACTENAAIGLTGTNPINLNPTTNQAPVSLTVTNTGNMPVTIMSASNIAVSVGTFTPSASFPITIAVGGSATINGIYTYTGAVPVSVTFTVSGNSTECGIPVIETASFVALVNRSACTESASISLSGTNPINLDPGTNQASVTLAVTNTGNMPITIQSSANVMVNVGTFVPSTSFPITISPGATSNIQGTYTYTGAVPVTATFNVTGNSTECGTPVTRSALFSATVDRLPCSETVAATLAATNPIMLNATTSQAPVNLTLTNTGNRPITVLNSGSVTVDRGTFTTSASFPITVQPGNSARISGTYYYSGVVPTSATFSVAFNGTECGAPVTRTANYTSSVDRLACTETALITMNATDPIALNASNQSLVNLTVRNTGNVAVTVAGAQNVSVSPGSFSPTSAFPVNINPGASAVIRGVYSYSGPLPVTATFNVTGNSTECGTPVTRLAAYASQVTSCPVAGIAILGVLQLPDGDYPIALENRSAEIMITVRNNGTAPLSVSAFQTGSSFTFDPDDGMPVVMNPGEIRDFNGTLEYTGSLLSQPSSVTITVLASSTIPVCGDADVRASIKAEFVLKGDLAPEIEVSDRSLNQTQTSAANVTVVNRGPGNITDSWMLKIKVMRCDALSDTDGSCELVNDDDYVMPPLDDGERTDPIEVSYECGGKKYVRIRATANPDFEPIEDYFGNNDAVENIMCSQDYCTVTGPEEIRLPGTYTFNANCFDSDGNNVSCGFMLDGGFTWTYAPPAPGDATIVYTMGGMEGPANENSSIHVQNTLANGTLNIRADAVVRDYDQHINCTKAVPIIGNPCELQI